ncbi:MAG: EamA family transporter [Treponema sp.]|nr:EamA family transporter [Treponema sp.]
MILYLGKRFVIYYDKSSWDFTPLGKVDNMAKAELKKDSWGWKCYYGTVNKKKIINHPRKLTMEKQKTNFGPLLIIIAACFWGSMGIFVRKLESYGFTAIQIVSIRLTLAALFFSILHIFIDRKGFKISLRDIPLFLGLGLGSILFFTICYFSAITVMSLSTAAILLYTSPIWIMLMSSLFFHEKLNAKKLIALAFAFAGCVLVSGISGGGITVVGLLLGLGSGFGYGLYSILGTIALRRYLPYTVTTCTFIFAACGSWFVCRPSDMISKFAGAENLPLLIGFCFLTALVTAVIPFLCYTLGLGKVEASKAGIIATLEPVVATIIGIVCFGERLTVISAAGIVLVLSGVVVLNLKGK